MISSFTFFKMKVSFRFQVKLWRFKVTEKHLVLSIRASWLILKCHNIKVQIEDLYNEKSECHYQWQNFFFMSLKDILLRCELNITVVAAVFETTISLVIYWRYRSKNCRHSSKTSHDSRKTYSKAVKAHGTAIKTAVTSVNNVVPWIWPQFITTVFTR